MMIQTGMQLLITTILLVNLLSSAPGWVPSLYAAEGASASVNVYNPIEPESVPELVNSMVKTILGIVGAVALLMFVYGGLLWMTSGGNERRIERGRDTLIWASVGLAVIFGSYAILSVLFKAFEGS